MTPIPAPAMLAAWRTAIARLRAPWIWVLLILGPVALVAAPLLPAWLTGAAVVVSAAAGVGVLVGFPAPRPAPPATTDAAEDAPRPPGPQRVP